MSKKTTKTFYIDPDALEVCRTKAHDLGIPLSQVIRILLRMWAQDKVELDLSQ